MTTPDLLLLNDPKWRADDLGAPLPNSPHANSVCLPMWQDVVDYEEKTERVIARLQAGYPRFVVPAFCTEFFERCRERFARDDEYCHAYPTEASARRAAACILAWSGLEARVVPWPRYKVYLTLFPSAAEPAARKYWRHTGDGISSRRAESLLHNRPQAMAKDHHATIRNRIAKWNGVPPDHVLLFKSGMAALYTVFRALAVMRPNSVMAQYGFPYVDTLKIVQEFGARSAFFPVGSPHDLKTLERMAQVDRLGGIFCEFPSNPLLRSPDLAALATMARNGRCPLVVDDTIATCVNVDLSTHADIVVTSLTKYFTGRGDVMAGAAVINPHRPLANEIRDALNETFEDATWGDDLALIARHSADFPERVNRVNKTAETVCDWLKTRHDVRDVYYPKYQTQALYDACRRPEGGYGGLFSLVLRDAPTTTPAFYDRLEISKGPNLGTTFSLCCPFTMLAHYDELDWAERCGVSRYLLRFSVGLEEPADLIARFERAFSH